MTYDTAREFVLKKTPEKILDVIDAANRGATLKQQATMLQVTPEYWCKVRQFLLRQRWEPSPVLVDLLEKDAVVKKFQAERAKQLHDELKSKIIPLYPDDNSNPKRA